MRDNNFDKGNQIHMNPFNCIGNYNFKSINFTFKLYELDHDVISCVQAANAKGISLKNELKTLVLETSNGLYIVNTSGENHVSLRQIKSSLGVKEAYLLSAHKLNEINLKPGAICPFLDQLWDLPMLIDKTVLDLLFVSTNNGIRNQFIIFPPKLLLLSPKHIIGTFGKPITKEVLK